MKVLVTGASGRVGRAICAHLGASHEVLGLDRLPSPHTQWVADVGDAPTLARALNGVQAVVHTAALHAPHVGVAPEAEFQRINVDATRQLLKLAEAAGVERFVFTSTTALYGHAATPTGRAGWVDEALPPQPRTIYHRSKLAAEALVQRAAANGRLSATVLRMSRCFAEPAALMAAYRLHRGVDVRDVANAHALALGLAEPGYRVFIASGATPFERADCPALAHDAARVLRHKAPELEAAFAQRGWPLPRSIDRVYVPHALMALGWQPRHGFDEVLRQLDAASPEVLPEPAGDDSGHSHHSPSPP